MSALAACAAALMVIAWPAGRAQRAVRARWGRDRNGRGSGLGRALLPWRVGARRLGLAVRRPGADAARWLPLLDQLAAALRVGLPPAEALTLALRGAPEAMRDQLDPVVTAAQEGRACGPAWLRTARSAGSAELELLARSWLISERLGAPLADAVDSAGRGLRSARDLASKLETATVGARSTALILTLLPVAGVGIALLMGIGPAQLYGSAPALVSLALGVLLMMGGRVIVTRMIAGVVRQ